MKTPSICYVAVLQLAKSELSTYTYLFYNYRYAWRKLTYILAHYYLFETYIHIYVVRSITRTVRVIILLAGKLATLLITDDKQQ